MDAGATGESLRRFAWTSVLVDAALLVLWLVTGLALGGGARTQAELEATEFNAIVVTLVSLSLAAHLVAVLLSGLVAGRIERHAASTPRLAFGASLAWTLVALFFVLVSLGVGILGLATIVDAAEGATEAELMVRGAWFVVLLLALTCAWGILHAIAWFVQAMRSPWSLWPRRKVAVLESVA